MQFYRTFVQRPGEGERFNLTYHGTMSEAHKEGKSFPKGDWQHVYIELIEVPHDKDGILVLLRGLFPVFKLVRNWELTTRGGTNEIPVEE